MKYLIIILSLLFLTGCPEEPPLCDYHLEGLKNYVFEIQVDGTDLSTQPGFTFPYLWISEAGQLQTDLNLWLSGDGMATLTFDANDALIIDIEQTGKVFDTLTISGTPGGTPATLKIFEQSNCN